MSSFETYEDVLHTPVVNLTEAQFLAFLTGRAAYTNGDPCYNQFHDTRLCWEAGLEWERRKRDTNR